MSSARTFKLGTGSTGWRRWRSALSAPRPARPADRHLAAAVPVLVVGVPRVPARPTGRMAADDPLRHRRRGDAGAGCTINDIVDRDIDARWRAPRDGRCPRARSLLARRSLFLGLQLIVGLSCCSRCRPWRSGLASPHWHWSAPIPFMKRITWWPQAFLGLTFNWGRCWAGRRAAISAGPPSGSMSPGFSGPVLRHDLCPSGQGGRCAGRREIDRFAAGKDTKPWLARLGAAMIPCWSS